MDTAYVLHHVRNDDEYGDHAKLIGIYRSQEAADAAIHRLRNQPGFRDHPSGFTVDPYPVDKDHWVDGFVDLSDES